jgi:hypothetical protein
MFRYAAAFILALATTASAQQPNLAGPNLPAQREAMKKLEFLVGKWSGPASILRGPGEALKITQSEDIQLKMDGLVLLIEGTGRDAAGKVLFRALATISFDDATSAYRFRAYHDGSFLDTELKASINGFEWGYAAGPLHVSNKMRLNEKGEWSEITESTDGSTPARRSVDMTLKRQ